MSSLSLPHAPRSTSTSATASIHPNPLSPNLSRSHLPLSFQSSLLPLISPSSLRKEGNLAAWTSLLQDRWSGDLQVQGNPPSLAGTHTSILHFSIESPIPPPPPLIPSSNSNAVRHIPKKRPWHLAHRRPPLGPPLRRLQFGTIVLPPPDRVRILQSRQENQPPLLPRVLQLQRSDPSSPPTSFLTDNANNGDGRILCLTETVRGSILIDPATLDTVGRFDFADGLWDFIQSPHPVVTEEEFLTLLPDFLRAGCRVVRMEAGTNERRVVGRVDCVGGPGPRPGWVHSFPVTENYVVVPKMVHACHVLGDGQSCERSIDHATYCY